MMIDYHTHHNRCGHAVGTIEDYVVRGMEIGLHQIGVTDHMPLFHINPSQRQSGVAMNEEELPRYVEEVLRLKEKYRGDIDILLGIEADYVEAREEETAELLGGYPWDYIIGSVHYLGGWDLFDSRQLYKWTECSVPAVYEAYYRAVAAAARSGLFDVIGHFDGLKRYGPPPIEYEWELQRRALDEIAGSGMALEVNTSGLRHAAGAVYPDQRILKYCARLGIPVTIGSDAHHVRHVGAGYGEAVLLLEQAGIRHVEIFHRRLRRSIPFTVCALMAE